jgi:hypothetical protein
VTVAILLFLHFIENAQQFRMGVEGLSKLLRKSKISLNHTDDVSGTMAGVNGYVLQHCAIFSKACVQKFRQFPPIDLHSHVRNETK